MPNLIHFLLLTVLVLTVSGHEPGAEYTFLSMFLKPRHKQIPSTASQLRKEYYQSAGIGRRRLKSTSSEPEQLETAILKEEKDLARAQSDAWEQGVEEESGSGEDGKVRLGGVSKAAVEQTDEATEKDTYEKDAMIGTDADKDQNQQALQNGEKNEENGKENENGTEAKSRDGAKNSNADDEDGESIETTIEDSDGGEDTKEEPESKGVEEESTPTDPKRPALAKLPKPVVRVSTGDGGDTQDKMGRKDSEKQSNLGKSTTSSDHQKKTTKSANSLDEDLKSVAQESLRHGEDVQQLCSMLRKLVKQYAVDSVVDVPCRAHTHWMPIFLKHVAQGRSKKFRYYCVDTNREILNTIKERVPNDVVAKFILKKFWKERLPQADLVFSWAGLDNMKQENAANFVHMLADSGKRHKLIMIGSHSGSLEKKGSAESVSRFTMGGEPINLRRSPFLLSRPMRIIGKLSKGGNDKQLYIYKPEEMIPEEEE